MSKLRQLPNLLMYRGQSQTSYDDAKRFEMENRYVEQREGGYYVTGTRVSLDSVVYAFLRGARC
jgi:hypothetical protein